MLDQKSKALSTGMNDFITKPFAPNNLLSVIQRYIKNTQIKVERISENINTGLVDQNRLNELYGDDKAYAADMIQTFLEDVLPDFAVIDELINQKDMEMLVQHVHKLKPTIGMVGLTDLEEKIKEFEKILKQETNVEPLKSLWIDFQKNLEDSLPALKATLQKLMQD
jgi:HPt (histidine-containing phosphotransfer) domain-containing protein